MLGSLSCPRSTGPVPRAGVRRAARCKGPVQGKALVFVSQREDPEIGRGTSAGGFFSLAYSPVQNVFLFISNVSSIQDAKHKFIMQDVAE